VSAAFLADQGSGLAFHLPNSRELGALFQEELANATGLAARWAADRVPVKQGMAGRWSVPFEGAGLKGSFCLAWDPALQRFLAARVGPAAARPEFLGAVLRAAAGRWASAAALRGHSAVRLQPSPEDGACVAEASPLRSSAALILDSFVIELAFALEPQGS
jgi:hypothetical protein